MNLFLQNQFDVNGKNVLFPGGSQGMGRSAARKLAEKGANIIVVARTESNLKEACEYVAKGAIDSSKQSFSYIVADLTSADECARIITESTKRWGAAPDVVWSCVGSSHPTLLVDTPAQILSDQMTRNYLSAAWIAQAAIKTWLGRHGSLSEGPGSVGDASTHSSHRPRRHIVFTSSFLALYTVAGYAPYSPSKCALRSLSDTLSQEVLLYQGVDIRVHTVFPATIYTGSFDAEQKIKSDLTKMLEEDDEGQSADECAAVAIRGLESGAELVPTTFLGRVVMCAVLGGSKRSSGLSGLMEGFLGLIMVLIMPWVRWFYDRKVLKWSRDHGESGAKRLGKEA